MTALWCIDSGYCDDWITPEPAWEDRWFQVPITKVTPKRIWIEDGFRGRKRSLDRATLERDGSIYVDHETYFTEVGKEDAHKRWLKGKAIPWITPLKREAAR